MALVDRALPTSTNVDAPAVQRETLHGTIPNLLNRAVPAAVDPGRA